MKKRRSRKYHGFKRGDRIGAAIHKIIASSLLLGTGDPRLSELSITAVEMTPDNRMAKVFFSMMADEKQVALARKGLAGASPLFKRKIADELRLQFTPELRFYHDTTLEHAQKMESLFERIRSEGCREDTDKMNDE